MALGSIGNGAVRLGRAGKALGLAEGIETGLSAQQLFEVPVWAALGSRMDRGRHYDQPLSGRIYRLVEADPVTRDAVSGRRATSWR